MMRLVVIESPYKATSCFWPVAILQRYLNRRYARACLNDSLLRGDAPIASHLLYTQPGVLDDGNPRDRSLGIAAGLAWLKVADASVVYTDRGISEGMRYSIAAAHAAGVPVEFRSLKPAGPRQRRFYRSWGIGG